MSSLRNRARAARGRVLAAEAHLPLRVRLLCIVVLLLLMAMSVTSLVSLQLLQNSLRSQVDDELSTKGVAAIKSAFPTFNQSFPANRLLSDYYVQVAAADGSQPIEWCTPDEDDSCSERPELPALTSAYVASKDGKPFTATDDGSGDPWRVLLFAGTSNGTRVNIAVALPLSGANETVADFRVTALSVGVAVLVLGGFAAALAIRRSFRPLDDIERTASAIAAGDLSQRVPDAPPATESVACRRR